MSTAWYVAFMAFGATNMTLWLALAIRIIVHHRWGRAARRREEAAPDDRLKWREGVGLELGFWNVNLLLLLVLVPDNRVKTRAGSF